MGSSASTLQSIDNEGLAPPQRVYYPSQAGFIIYWVVYGIMTVACITFVAMTLRKPMRDRAHGYLTALIVAIAGTAYWSMAAHGGDTLIPLYWDVSGARDVYWARYIDWFLTTPLLILDILLLAAVPVGTALWIVAADILMILFGLFGAITSWSTRWGYYAIGCFFMIVVFWGLLFVGPKFARARSMRLSKLYTFLAAYLSVLFLVYPIIWGLAEGSNTISVTAEIACYGALDVLAKVVFGAIVIANSGMMEEELNMERGRGMHDVSLLDAPITAPFSAVTRRLNAGVKHGLGHGDAAMNVDDPAVAHSGGTLELPVQQPAVATAPGATATRAV